MYSIFGIIYRSCVPFQQVSQQSFNGEIMTLFNLSSNAKYLRSEKKITVVES